MPAESQISRENRIPQQVCEPDENPNPGSEGNSLLHRVQPSFGIHPGELSFRSVGENDSGERLRTDLL